MYSYRRLSLFAVFSLFFVVACSSLLPAQAPLKTVQGKQGGKIVYGRVDGAATPAMAMARMLRLVQNDNGNKPQAGRVFRVRGSNSDAVFYSVTNQAGGNTPVAGMLIASQTGPNTVEAGLVSDVAMRFGSTVNPLLNQLFSVWHPGGAVSPTGSGAAQPGGRTEVPLPPMRQVTLPDQTATISLPAGWNIVPDQSGMAITTVTGPQGERLGLNQYYLAWDPYNPQVQNRLRRRIMFQNEIDIPTNVDLTKYYADILQKIRVAFGQPPAPLKVDSVQPVSGSQGQCVTAIGQINPDNTTMRDMNYLMCRSTPNEAGQYFLTMTRCLLPLGASDQQRATAAAIMASYKPDMQRAQAIANAQSAPMIAQMNAIYQSHQQALMSFTQAQIARTREIGAQATQRYNDADQARLQSRAQFESRQDLNARSNQEFHNYLLDQTVVQDNNMYGNGTIGHGTLWNSTADALVKADPNRFEYVDKPNYWRGTDYAP